jgi:hypothetical protein
MSDHRDCDVCGWHLEATQFTNDDVDVCVICEDPANREGGDIHVGEPRTREEVRITRGETDIYLVKYDEDLHYIILTEHGDDTGQTWSGGVDGIHAFHALSDIFDGIEAQRV